VAILVLLAAPRAEAGPVAVSGTLRLELAPASAVVVTIPASGVAIVNPAGAGAELTGLELPAGLASGMVSVPITDPAAFPIEGVVGTLANQAASFAAAPGGGFGGVMPLSGVLRICLFAGCDAAIANLSIPLDPIGAGGAATAQPTDTVSLTVVGAPWTTTTVAPVPTFTDVTAMGFRHGPGTGTSSAALPSASLQLVTPIRLHTNIGTVPTPGVATLTLHLVPEPAIAGPLAAAAALAARAGMRRSARRVRRRPSDRRYRPDTRARETAPWP
jgi:hypothetical protein